MSVRSIGGALLAAALLTACSPGDAARGAPPAGAALESRGDQRSGPEIASAIDAFRRGAGRRGYFDRAGSPYQASEFGQLTELPADAAADGITGAAGLLLEAAAEPYRTVLVSYLVFDDPGAARTYFEKLDRNISQSMREVAVIDLQRDVGPSVEVRCVFVPDANNAVNCHYLGPGDRIVAVLLFTDGPALNFSGGKRAIDLVFASAGVEPRIRAVLADTAAYLFDAVSK